MNREVNKGELYFVNLEAGRVAGLRPYLILSVEGNQVKACPLTTSIFAMKNPELSLVLTPNETNRLPKASAVLTSCVEVIEVSKLGNLLGCLTTEEMACLK